MGFFYVKNNTEFRVQSDTGLIIKDPVNVLPLIPQAQLSNFSATTTSGTILVDWGDGLSDTLSSGIPINHSYLCPGAPAAPGFWDNVQPCI